MEIILRFSSAACRDAARAAGVRWSGCEGCRRPVDARRVPPLQQLQRRRTGDLRRGSEVLRGCGRRIMRDWYSLEWNKSASKLHS